MKLTKCPNKHYYDANKYDECPHCVPSEEKNVPLATTVNIKANTDQKTVRFIDLQNHDGEYDIPSTDIEPESKLVPYPLPEAQSLQSQIDAVTANQPNDEFKTVAHYNLKNIEPVVGWVVCVRGEYVGQSFTLKEGQNLIGRALSMDVALAKDTSVSRQKHATLTYDPRSCEFFIQPGDSSGLTYLNESLLLAHQSLTAQDVITVGNTELIFIPFCNKEMTWKKYIQ
jgi:hypothetical protein